jgi:hypothetical protein
MPKMDRGEIALQMLTPGPLRGVQNAVRSAYGEPTRQGQKFDVRDVLVKRVNPAETAAREAEKIARDVEEGIYGPRSEALGKIHKSLRLTNAKTALAFYKQYTELVRRDLKTTTKREPSDQVVAGKAAQLLASSMKAADPLDLRPAAELETRLQWDRKLGPGKIRSMNESFEKAMAFAMTLGEPFASAAKSALYAHERHVRKWNADQTP